MVCARHSLAMPTMLSHACCDLLACGDLVLGIKTGAGQIASSYSLIESETHIPLNFILVLSNTYITLMEVSLEKFCS